MRAARHDTSLAPLTLMMAALAGTVACGTDGGESRAPCLEEQRCPQTSDGGTETTGLLISPQALEATDDLQVVDARSESAYAAGHVPGALWVDMQALRTTVDGVPGQLPAPATVADVLGAAGLAPDRRAVVYGTTSDLAGARLLWTLEFMGHGEVSLLDGGFEGFQAHGAELEMGPAAAPGGDYPDDRTVQTRRVDVAWVQAHLDDPDVVLVDARSQAEYVAGHIPGAVHRNWQNNVEDGRLKPLEALRASHAELPEDGTLVTYCQTGSRAAMAYFTLRYLGFEDVRLYDGSMAEWAQDDSRPLQTGP